MRHRRAGFTLIEITVALIIGGMALSAAAALLNGLGTRADQIRNAGRRVDRAANAERLLRGLVGNLRVSGDSIRTVSGDSTSVTWLSWCETVEGWLRPCRARLADSNGSVRLELELNSGESQDFTLSVGNAGPVAIRYLRDPVHDGRWLTTWADIVPPAAIELITGPDTLLLPAW